MSRELKFRAILRGCENKNKLYQVEMINFADNQICLKSFERGNYIGFEKLTDCKLMQFIGLKDRRGREIYEGDIIEISTFDLKKGDYTRKSEVYFLEGSFCIYTEDWFSQPLSDDIAKECKVIGNIYENPQLLGEQK